MRKTLAKQWCAALLLVCALSPSAQAASQKLVPLGVPVGVRMTAAGVVVSAMTTVDSPAGEICPGQQAGLEAGDILQAANGETLSSSSQLAEIVKQSRGNPIRFTGLRGDTDISVSVQPVKSKTTGTYQIGILVRDSMAGIGTLTYVDPESGEFGALGHPVSDIDSGALMPLETGSIVPASVIGAVAGEAGTPGELVGTYEFSREIGQLNENTACGIFGTLTDSSLYSAAYAVDTAEKEEIYTGKAEILLCVSGKTPEYYEIVIEKVATNAVDGRSLTIRVTDPELLEKTGGIVPGMSGSPILQDGKLVGAVTHVLVNNPARGYGIFIENMLDAAE